MSITMHVTVHHHFCYLSLWFCSNTRYNKCTVLPQTLHYDQTIGQEQNHIKIEANISIKTVLRG